MPDFERSLSSLSTGSQSEDDWDRSLLIDSSSLSVSTEPGTANSVPFTASIHAVMTTPRNSIVFPADETPGRSSRYSSLTKNDLRENGKGGKRTLSELLKLHSEKGSNGTFTPEEATRIADVLGQWINASSSPYEGEDDFFARTAQDDLSLASKRPTPVNVSLAGRPRGRSESANSAYLNISPAFGGSRPPSSIGQAGSSSS
ncbi:hypothetical protein BJ165DRAFT_1487556 [Panaeolus papilionaceus]|nr:hypothetical protein BJ165DRAFT_1487556 [Panaeolus papilionaceus]